MNEDTYWLGWLTRFLEASGYRYNIESDIDWGDLHEIYSRGYSPQDAFDNFFRVDETTLLPP